MKALIINDTTAEKHIGCIHVVENIKNKSREVGITVNKTLSRKATISDFKNSLRTTDLVIINGEGSLHHSPSWFENVLRCIPSNKKVVLINSIWDKMYIDPKLLEKINLVSVRESLSYEQAVEVFPKEKVRVVPDIVLATKVNQYNIGCCGSVLPTLNKQLKESTNFNPVHYMNEIPSIESYVAWLRTLKVYITGRFHGICLAALAEVPFLAFPSNSHKVEGMLKDMGCEELLINSFDEINNEKINRATNLVPKVTKYKLISNDKINKLFQDIKKI